jgi:sugar phosphate isomerase/epimerase
MQEQHAKLTVLFSSAATFGPRLHSRYNWCENHVGTMRYLGIIMAAALLAGTVSAAENSHSFFAFCMDTHDAEKRTLEQQAQLLKELGYDGCGHLWLDNVAGRLKTLDAAGLKLYQISITVDVGPSAKQPYDPRLADVLPLLKGRGVQLALLMPGGKSSDQSLDAHAVDLIRQIAGRAEPVGAEVVLYPHTGFWLETIQDAVRVADKVGQPNVGVMFNLCHWLRVSKDRNYRQVLELAMPRLRAVSINGADVFDENPGFGRYIQPLDAGNFDVGGFLKTLYGAGYKGPVGLQCWGIGGDARTHLARSISAWRRLEAADGK